MPYCQECGEEIDPESSFCNSCGAPIKAGESQKERKSGERQTESKKAGPQGRNSLDIDENIEGALTYVLTWLTGIIFYILEEKSDFVRFHAKQSIITFLPLTIIITILRWVGTPRIGYGTYSPGIPALMWLSWILSLVLFLLWLFLMFKAYQGERWKVPVLGDLAEDLFS